MQELKEEFRKIYETSENPTEGLLSISEWLAKSSIVFTKSCQTIRNWFGEIISYFERRTTNGVVEGINNKLKLIKRRGYGFRNFRNFWVRSMLSWHLVCWFSIKSNEEPVIFAFSRFFESFCFLERLFRCSSPPLIMFLKMLRIRPFIAVAGNYTKSVGYRLHIRTGTHARGTHAKEGIDNQSLITGFSIIVVIGLIVKINSLNFGNKMS